MSFPKAESKEQKKPDPATATIADLFWRGDILKGEVGIEIEAEGNHLPDDGFKYWTVTTDGSLRGAAREYVLTRPVPRGDVVKALEEWDSVLKASGARVINSGRAGIHVHINVRDLTPKQMFAFIFLYLSLEKPLVRFCGENREGNLFCLQGSEAENLISTMYRFFQSFNYDNLRSDNIRYASINLTALNKYGSLEFRSMESGCSLQKLKDWVDVLLLLKDKSKEISNLQDIVNGVSFYGGEEYAKQYLGGHFNLFQSENWRKEVMEGIRLIQPCVYVINEQALLRDVENRINRNIERETPRRGEDAHSPRYLDLVNNPNTLQGIQVRNVIAAEEEDVGELDFLGDEE